MDTNQSSIKVYWDYGTWIEEITNTWLCCNAFLKYMVDRGMVDSDGDTFSELGLGNVFLSPASGNFFITPL